MHELRTDLLDAARLPTVVLTNDPLGPLAQMEAVGGHRVVELFGQRAGALQYDLPLRKDAPGLFDGTLCEAILVFLWLFLRRQSGDPALWFIIRGQWEKVVWGF